MKLGGRNAKYNLCQRFYKWDTAISYEDGLECKNIMTPLLDKNEQLILNFTGVVYVITAFLNPIISDCILKYGEIGQYTKC